MSTDGLTHEEMGTRHLRGSSLLLVGRVTAMVVAMATQVVIVRYLTKDDFGGFALALTITSASRFLLSLGQGKTLSRFLAIYLEQRDYGKLFGSVVVAAGTVLLTGALLIGALFAARTALHGSVLETDTAVTVLLIVVFLAPMEALDQLFVGLFAVFTRPRSIFFRKYLFTPVLRLAVVGAVAMAGGSIVMMAVGYVAAQVLGLMVYVTMLRRVMHQQGLLEHLHWRTMEWPVRNVFTFALPMLSTELVFLSMNTGSVLLLSYYGTAADVADLRAVFPAAGLNKIVYATFLTLYLPMASRLFARGDHDAMREDYWRTAAFLAVVTFPIFALTGPFADETTVQLFGDRYADSGTVLALLAVGYYVNSALGFNLVTLQAYGKVRLVLLVNLACAVLNLVLSLAVIPRYGAVGVAAVNGLTMVVQNVGYQVGVARTMRSAFVDRRYLPTYAWIAAVAGILWLLEWALEPALWGALLLGAAGTLVLVAANRPALALAHSFPELARVPGVRWVIGGAPPGS